LPFRCSDADNVDLLALPHGHAHKARVQGASLLLQTAPLAVFESAEAFGGATEQLDALLARLPLTLFALEFNDVVRFESATFRAFTPTALETLAARSGGGTLLNKRIALSALLPPSSRAIVESVRARPGMQVTLVAHSAPPPRADVADVAAATSHFAVEFLNHSTPAHGLLAREGVRDAVRSALRDFARGGVSFVLCDQPDVEEHDDERLFAHYRDESSARLVGLARAAFVELVLDLAADEYGDVRSINAAVSRALAVAVDALSRREPQLLAKTSEALERRSVEFASVALAMQAVRAQSQSPLFVAQTAPFADSAQLMRRICARVYEEARDDSQGHLLHIVSTRVMPVHHESDGALFDLGNDNADADDDDARQSSTASM
jgi:hypothetical protein